MLCTHSSGVLPTHVRLNPSPAFTSSSGRFGSITISVTQMLLLVFFSVIEPHCITLFTTQFLHLLTFVISNFVVVCSGGEKVVG